MLDVISLGDYYAAIDDAESLPELRDEVNRICGERFRRIDRFIQLCLLGSARCAQGLVLDSQTGLYIGSRFAALCNTIKVQEQMFVHGQIPKPANFINTLSNSAGYYVARNLKLQGKNIFVSRGNNSLEAALQLAQLDLQTTQIDQALIGVVDEGVPEQAAHCRRMGIAEDTELGEGSHWFLVRRESDSSCLARVVDVRTLSDESALRDWLTDYQARRENTYIYRDAVCQGKITETHLNGLNLCIEAYEPPLKYYPSRTAGILSCFIKEKIGRQEIDKQGQAALITLCGDDAGRSHVTYTVVG
ncbi:MAG: hypothetical protein KUG71_13090 [Porticoccaceae bacterium]|nr:hypothetical protein [Porticoccaceae bacterium]